MGRRWLEQNRTFVPENEVRRVARISQLLESAPRELQPQIGSQLGKGLVGMLEHSVPLDRRSGGDRRKAERASGERRVSMEMFLPQLRVEFRQIYETLQSGLKDPSNFPRWLSGAVGEHTVARMLISDYPIYYPPAGADERQGTDWMIGLDDANPPGRLVRLQVKSMKFSGGFLRYFPIESSRQREDAIRFAQANGQNFRTSLSNLLDHTNNTERGGLVILNRLAFIEENQVFDPLLGIPLNPKTARELRRDLKSHLEGRA